MKQEDYKKLQCYNCRRQIDLGRDLITAEKGVSGPRGIVPLGDIKIFCNDKCVKQYFNGEPDENLPEIPRRIP